MICYKYNAEAQKLYHIKSKVLHK